MQRSVFAIHTLPPPRTRPESSLLMLLTHTDSSSHFLLFHSKRSLFTCCSLSSPRTSFLPQNSCSVIIPRALTSLISTDVKLTSLNFSNIITANIYYTNHLTCIISFDYPNHPMKKILFITHSTDKETEVQIDKQLPKVIELGSGKEGI